MTYVTSFLFPPQKCKLYKKIPISFCFFIFYLFFSFFQLNDLKRKTYTKVFFKTLPPNRFYAFDTHIFDHQYRYCLSRVFRKRHSNIPHISLHGNETYIRNRNAKGTANDLRYNNIYSLTSCKCTWVVLTSTTQHSNAVFK